MHYKTAFIEMVQWVWILMIGFFTSTQNFHDDIHKIVVTIASMVLGTYASYLAKKYLNDKTNDMKFWDYFLGKRDVEGARRLGPVNIFVWLLTGIALGLILNWIF